MINSPRKLHTEIMNHVSAHHSFDAISRGFKDWEKGDIPVVLNEVYQSVDANAIAPCMVSNDPDVLSSVFSVSDRVLQRVSYDLGTYHLRLPLIRYVFAIAITGVVNGVPVDEVVTAQHITDHVNHVKPCPRDPAWLTRRGQALHSRDVLFNAQVTFDADGWLVKASPAAKVAPTAMSTSNTPKVSANAIDADTLNQLKELVRQAECKEAPEFYQTISHRNIQKIAKLLGV